MGLGTGLRGGGTHALRRMVAALVVLGALSLAVADARPTSAQECAMQPQVRDHTINQGVGSYDQLTPGKETLVRLYLSMPSCAPVGAEMQLTGASISVKLGAVTLKDGIKSTPALPSPPVVGQDTNTYPPIAQWAAAPMKNATADPIFVIDGAVLDHALLGSVPVPISVTGALQYRYRIGTGAWQSGSVPSTGDFTAEVGVRTNPLRVLVVPMGDVSSREVQFPLEATTAVQNGMRALSRMLPVADGVELLTSTTGGLRYHIVPHLLDLGPEGLGLMDSRNDFCGTFTTFNAIQAELDEYLRGWNSVHDETPADRVVGAVWEGISVSPLTNSSCGDGWAKASSAATWIRVVEDRDSQPSSAGALFGMELLHTWGVVSKTVGGEPNPRASSLHSVHTQADVTDPDRAYHVAGRSWLADDRSVMRYTPAGWHQHSTVLEPEDWAHTQCVLVKPPAGLPPTCEKPNSVGMAPGALESYFSIAGVTDGTHETTHLHTYRSEERLETPPDDASEFRLIQRDSTGVALGDDVGVPTSDAHSSHTHDETGGEEDQGTDEAGTSGYAIDATVRIADGAARFELWRGDPDAGALLYARNLDDPPEAGQATTVSSPGEVQDVAADPVREETRPAVTGDGRWIAWVESEGIRVAPVDRSKPASVPLPGTDPSWTPDGSALVFVRDGSLLRVTVDTAGASATFTDEYVVYNRSLQPAAGSGVSRPSVGPDGRHTAVALSGDLYVIDSTFRPTTLNPLLCPIGTAVANGPCRRIVSSSAVEASPSWSSAGVFFEREASLWRVQADGSGDQRVTDGDMPSAGPTDLVFVRGGRVWVRSLAEGTETALTSGVTDAWPAATPDLQMVALERVRQGQSDIVRLDASDRIHVVTVRDDNPGDLRLDVFLGSEPEPIVAGLHPVSTTASEARFEVRIRPFPGAGGQLSGRATDGWSTAWFDWDELVTEPAVPVPSIHTPAPGTELLQFSAVHLSGDARLGDVPLDDSLLQWSLVRLGSGGGVERQAAGRVVDLDPPVGGWQPGDYEVRLVATAGDRSATHAVPITIEADVDRDGIGASRDLRSCIEDADHDPTNFDDDDDGDGLPFSEDPAPCTSANNAVANFEPDTYYVPAQGEYFTVHLTSSSVDLKKVSAASVAIREVGRFPVDIRAVAWSVDKKGNTSARFPRPDLDAFFRAHPEFIGGYVPVVITGGGGATSFRARDATAPNVQPSS